MSFQGKAVLVTGGTSGIGAATARKFAEKGARVVIVGRDPNRGREAEARFRAQSLEVRYVQADVGDRRQVDRLFETLEKDYGKLDIACNGAAVPEVGGKPLADWSEDEYDYQMAANLKGVWRCMKHEIRMMLQGGGGAIVNISSINGLGGAAGAALYSAAKHAVVGLTKSAGIEYAKHGIRINALCAGAFRTPLLERSFKTANAAHPEQVEAMYTSLIPAGRIGDPGEAAEAVLWLSSPQSSYVTGHSMIVDGGFTSLMR